MPFDGSGNFNRVMNWANDALANIKIRADRHDQEDDNFASGLSSVITKDGQTQPVADLPLNGHKLVNLGAPTLPTDAATKGYVDANVKPAIDVGAIQLFAQSTPPPGWLKANGAAVPRATYSALFAAIGTIYGSGDGTTTFNLPDLRGEFIRIWDDARGVDTGRAFGSAQGANVEAHTHTASPHTHTASSGTESVGHTHTVSVAGSTDSQGAHAHNYTAPKIGGSSNYAGGGTQSGPATQPGVTDTQGAHAHNVSASGTTSGESANHTHAITVNATAAGTPVLSSYGTGTDTRPRNVALMACIRY